MVLSVAVTSLPADNSNSPAANWSEGGWTRGQWGRLIRGQRVEIEDHGIETNELGE